MLRWVCHKTKATFFSFFCPTSKSQQYFYGVRLLAQPEGLETDFWLSFSKRMLSLQLMRPFTVDCLTQPICAALKLLYSRCASCCWFAILPGQGLGFASKTSFTCLLADPLCQRDWFLQLWNGFRHNKPYQWYRDENGEAKCFLFLQWKYALMSYSLRQIKYAFKS